MHRTARRAVTAPLRPALQLALPLALGVAPSIVGCGGSAEPPASAAADVVAPGSTGSTPPAPTDASKAAPEKVGPVEVPTTCEPSDGFCLPPARFTKKLCAGFHPDVALAMFAKGTPWTRGYLKMNVEAVNASGGVSSGDQLVFDEEVIVLVRRQADTGGMQVSGAGGGYDVLRWDGTCATLSGEELTTKAPPKPRHPKLKWQDLGETTQAKLLDDAKIAKINADRRKECKGVTIGAVSDKCVKAVDALSLAIVDWVRAGGSVPPPPALP